MPPSSRTTTSRCSDQGIIKLEARDMTYVCFVSGTCSKLLTLFGCQQENNSTMCRIIRLMPNYRSLAPTDQPIALSWGHATIHEIPCRHQVIMRNGNLPETRNYSDWAWTQNVSVALAPGPHVVTLCFIGNALVRVVSVRARQT